MDLSKVISDCFIQEYGQIAGNIKSRGINVKLLLIGRIGIGKTTICQKIVEKAKQKEIECVGILTEKTRAYGRDLLVVKELSGEERKILAYKNPIHNQEVQHGIHFCNFVFDSSAIEFAKKALCKVGDLLVIDEIGPLEIQGKGIDNAISAFESSKNKNSILVTRKELRDDISVHINCSFEIMEVNELNRERLPEIIFGRIFQK